MTLPVEILVPCDADAGTRIFSQAWTTCLHESGFEVRIADVKRASAVASAVIIDPHAALRPLADAPLRIADMLRRAVCVSTSRFASGALGADRPFHSAAAASIALSRDSSRYLSAHGVRTAHLKPGSHWHLRAPHADLRAVAVGAQARYSGFREDVVARSRDVLDRYTCDLRISRSADLHPPGHLEAADWLLWLGGVEVLVSLPAESGPGLDWCEVAPAVMNGAVVITTAESDFGPLEPGEDIAVATREGFADALRRLLADRDRREAMRKSALAHLSEHPLDVSSLADAIDSVAGNGRRVRPLTVPAPDTVAGSQVPDDVDVAAALSATEDARSHRAQAQTGGDDRVTVTRGWDALRVPDLSVVIPSYGQAAYVGAAIESALAAVDVGIEVVVIDDRSSDGSAAIVHGLLAAHDTRALKLVERADNGGLASARNHGFQESRAPAVLLLDADDVLLPHGPAALHAALQADPAAAFAYGLLARFGLECEDLLGTSPWDPELFRFGNYVPVTGSLVRRSAWELVGGYSADGLLELGWEDFDFWLRLAEAGQHAAHVRRIVGGYRVHGVSMSSVTDNHAGALMQFMRERHPRLLGAG